MADPATSSGKTVGATGQPATPHTASSSAPSGGAGAHHEPHRVSTWDVLNRSIRIHNLLVGVLRSDLAFLRARFPTPGDIADMSLPNRYGSPLHLAVTYASQEVVEFLAGVAQCDPSAVHPDTGNTVLHAACVAGRAPLVDWLMSLERFPWDAHARNFEGRLPEELAATPDTAAVIRERRKQRAGVAYKQLGELAGRAPFDVSNQAIFALLCNHPSLDANHADPANRGNTLLHQAVAAGNHDLAEWVCRNANANLDARNADGQTPLDLVPAAAKQQLEERLKAAKHMSAGSTGGPEKTQATPANHPSHEGYLEKWVNYAFGYRRRYFVLEYGRLAYYKHRASRTKNSPARGYLNLQFADVKVIDSHHGYDPTISSTAPGLSPGKETPTKASMSGASTRFIVVSKGNGSYHLKGDTAAETHAWLEKLREAVQVKSKEPYGANHRIIVAQASNLESDDDEEDTAFGRGPVVPPKRQDSLSPMPSPPEGTLPSRPGNDTSTSTINALSLAGETKQPTPPDYPTTRDGANGYLSSTFILLTSEAEVLHALVAYLAEHNFGPTGLSTALAPHLHHGAREHAPHLLEDVKQMPAYARERLMQCVAEFSAGRTDTDADKSSPNLRGSRRSFGFLRAGSTSGKHDGGHHGGDATAAPGEPSSGPAGDTASSGKRRKKSIGAAINAAASGLKRTLSTPTGTPTAPAAAMRPANAAVGGDAPPAPEDRDEFFDAESDARLNSTRRASLGSQKESVVAAVVASSSAGTAATTPNVKPVDWTASFQASLKGYPSAQELPRVARRELPLQSKEKRPDASVWAIVKDSLGKDLTRLSVPVYYNEPLSMLQRLAEEIEYSDILDVANAIGTGTAVRPVEDGCIPIPGPNGPAIGVGSGLSDDPRGGSLERLLYAASFAVSNYSNTDGRMGKPFNPLLGETYEWVRPDRGFRYIAEQVSHHPPVSACHCESANYAFYAQANIKNKFVPVQTLEISPQGTEHLHLKAWKEHYTCSKVTTYLYNLMLGRMYIDHGGLMTVESRTRPGERARMTFKTISKGKRITGEVLNAQGEVRWTIDGHWTTQLTATPVYPANWPATALKDTRPCVIWKRSPMPPNAAQACFNFTYFAIEMNHLYDSLKEYLPPTDSRMRPDQHSLEHAEYSKASEEKTRLEEKQRAREKERAQEALARKQGQHAGSSGKLVAEVDVAATAASPSHEGSPTVVAKNGQVVVREEDWWSPRWFVRETDPATGETIWVVKEGANGYWETRERKDWSHADIF